MPTYEYRCDACHREFEVQQKMSDPDLVHCEACGEDRLQRLISWTSVRSSGWQGALQSSNPREALKGAAAFDRGKPQRFGEAATAEPAGDAGPAPEAATGATTDATTGATTDATVDAAGGTKLAGE